ncbi:MAG: SIS domain-containing protein [Leptolinea sp.]
MDQSKTSGFTKPLQSSSDEILAFGKMVLSQEANALQLISESLGHSFVEAVNLILNSNNRVIIIGLGKSGHVGKKIAATLASLGTPSFFLHAVEAMHGDLGMITKEDVLILISHSGETSEITNLLPHLTQFACPMIAITGRPDSTLAKAATVHLDTGVRMESDSRGLAPTSSTTVTIAIGDALALTLADMRGFSRQAFGKYHPGGSLGKTVLSDPHELITN